MDESPRSELELPTSTYNTVVVVMCANTTDKLKAVQIMCANDFIGAAAVFLPIQGAKSLIFHVIHYAVHLNVIHYAVHHSFVIILAAVHTKRQ